jgi:hypothetical protein
MPPFRFDTDYGKTAAWVAELPRDIQSVDELFEQLCERLQFPDYFGHNWDAFEECVRDLSWLPPGPVVLRHRDLPLAGDLANQRVYLEILRDAVEKRHAVPGQVIPDLIVIFPPGSREQTARILQSPARD